MISSFSLAFCSCNFCFSSFSLIFLSFNLCFFSRLSKFWKLVKTRDVDFCSGGTTFGTCDGYFKNILKRTTGVSRHYNTWFRFWRSVKQGWVKRWICLYPLKQKCQNMDDTFVSIVCTAHSCHLYCDHNIEGENHQFLLAYMTDHWVEMMAALMIQKWDQTFPIQ